MTDRYFTVDTAERATLEAWKKKNPHNITYIFDGDEFMGFVEILPPETMQYAQYLYISGIAIPDTSSHRSRRAAAALASCGAGMIKHLYGGGHLKKVFANPTTYWGNRIIGRFGLRPMSTFKKLLRAGNDIYVADAEPQFWNMVDTLEKRYQRFISNYPWPLE